VKLAIRSRLTLLYFVVLAATFVAFFWICDFGFRRSIETTVNEASRSNLDIVERVVDGSLPRGLPKVHSELNELSELWANGAIFAPGFLASSTNSRRSDIRPFSIHGMGSS
jgi:hypothetical protein